MIIQKSKKYRFDKPEVERIKGHTIIELKDAKTKHRKVIESDNTFQTDILADKMLGGVFRFGAYDDVPYANGLSYLYSSFTLSQLAYAQMVNTVGGIMLFDGEIEEGSRYMPAGTKMIGNGGYGITNNATPVELGSYNSVESAIGNNSFQFVYDWGTSQGNGTIASVCLTSRQGGLMGMGNPSGGIRETLINPCAYQTRAGRLTQSNAIHYGDALYVFESWDLTNKTITVRKHTLNGISKASIFDGRGKLIQNEGETGDVSFTFTAAQNVYTRGGGVPWVMTDGKGKILIPIPYNVTTWYSWLPDNAVGYYIELDCTTDTFALKSFTNHTGIAIYWGYSERGAVAYDSDNNYVLAIEQGAVNYDYAYRLIILDLTDGTLIKTLIGDSSTHQEKGGFKLAEDLWYCGGYQRPAYVYDSVNDTLYPTNAVIGDGSFLNSANNSHSYVDEESGLIFSRYSSSNFVYYNPCFLATINNLDNTVTKDPTQTMKITYTLTEV